MRSSRHRGGRPRTRNRGRRRRASSAQATSTVTPGRRTASFHEIRSRSAFHLEHGTTFPFSRRRSSMRTRVAVESARRRGRRRARSTAVNVVGGQHGGAHLHQASARIGSGRAQLEPYMGITCVRAGKPSVDDDRSRGGESDEWSTTFQATRSFSVGHSKATRDPDRALPCTARLRAATHERHGCCSRASLLASAGPGEVGNRRGGASRKDSINRVIADSRGGAWLLAIFKVKGPEVRVADCTAQVWRCGHEGPAEASISQLQGGLAGVR